jgi:hypothetical protein
MSASILVRDVSGASEHVLYENNGRCAVSHTRSNERQFFNIDILRHQIRESSVGCVESE